MLIMLAESRKRRLKLSRHPASAGSSEGTSYLNALSARERNVPKIRKHASALVFRQPKYSINTKTMRVDALNLTTLTGLVINSATRRHRLKAITHCVERARRAATNPIRALMTVRGIK